MVLFFVVCIILFDEGFGFVCYVNFVCLCEKFVNSRKNNSVFIDLKFFVKVGRLGWMGS